MVKQWLSAECVQPLFVFSLEFQRCEEVVDGFGAADEGDAVVFVQEELSAAELAVVVEAHGVAVGTGVVDDEEVAFFDRWQFALDGKFVAVFAEATDDVVNVIVWRVFLAEDGDVVVSAVHTWAHEVGHGGVNADVVAVGVLVVDGAGDEVAVRAGHHAAAFEHDLERIEAGWHDDLVVHFLDQAGNVFEIHWFLFWAIWDADAAAEIDEGNAHAGFFINFDNEIEHYLGGFSEIFWVELVGNDHGVETEFFAAFFFADGVGFDDLVLGEAVFRFFRLADELVAIAQWARVVAEADGLWQLVLAFDVFDVADVVEVEDGAEFDRVVIFCHWGVVRGEHDVFAGHADLLGEDELWQRAAVGAEAFFLEDLQQTWVWCGFDGEVFFEFWRPAECVLQAVDVVDDGFFIVDVKWGWIGFGDLFHFFFGKRNGFFGHVFASLNNYTSSLIEPLPVVKICGG